MFMHAYFDKVRRGTNVVGREYDYVRCTPRNRAAFVRRCADALKTDALTVHELHQFIELLCPDFPVSVLDRTGLTMSYLFRKTGALDTSRQHIANTLAANESVISNHSDQLKATAKYACKPFFAAFRVHFVYMGNESHISELTFIESTIALIFVIS
eukprot:jgi/Hompol1/4568/HPOL_003709-RA